MMEVVVVVEITMFGGRGASSPLPHGATTLGTGRNSSNSSSNSSSKSWGVKDRRKTRRGKTERNGGPAWKTIYGSSSSLLRPTTTTRTVRSLLRLLRTRPHRRRWRRSCYRDS
ncbi:unnamed protein product [Pylaiella littoralis]